MDRIIERISLVAVGSLMLFVAIFSVGSDTLFIPVLDMPKPHGGSSGPNLIVSQENNYFLWLTLTLFILVMSLVFILIGFFNENLLNSKKYKFFMPFFTGAGFLLAAIENFFELRNILATAVLFLIAIILLYLSFYPKTKSVPRRSKSNDTKDVVS